MMIIKLFFRIICFFQYIFLKLLYGSRLKVGKRVAWRRNFLLMIDSKAQVLIGNDCFFNNECTIDSIGKIIIESGTICGENVKMYDHNHRFKDRNSLIKEQGYSIGIIKIGKNCWIGSNVTILKDTHIGDNCVIGAGSVISGYIPSGTIVKNRSQYEYIDILR